MDLERNVLKVGIIGAGRIGQVHARTIARHLDGVELTCVVDAKEEAAEKLARSLGVARYGQTPDMIFEDADVDAVLICSPTDTHATLIEAAAEAGKHIFCEKPIALNLDRIDEALAVVEREGVKLQIGFNRRFDPTFAEVERKVRAGAVGEPQLLRITSRDPAPPPMEYVRVSGGIFLDMTIHDFDMARFLVGSEVVEVHACGDVLVVPEMRDAGDVDTAIVTLRFANGAMAAIDNSRKSVYGYDQRVEVFGSLGMVGAGNESSDRSWGLNEGGSYAPKPLPFFMERYADAYTNEIQSFIAAIKNDEPTAVSGADGRAPVVIALAAKKSLRENRPVRLTEIDRSFR